MKVRQWFALCTALAVLLGPWAEKSISATVNGRTSTVFEWSEDVSHYNTDQDNPSVPLYQYLFLTAKDLGIEGLNFKTYGRVGTDLKDEVDAESRLYFAYLENKWDNGAFRLGRQFIVTTAGASMMDGLRLDFLNLGSAKLSVFGGGDVKYNDNYRVRDSIAGAELTFLTPDTSSLKLSYLQKREEGYISNQLIGLEAYYNIKDQINFYNETQYNYSKKTISYFLGGLKYYQDTNWSVRGEYLYSLPVFSDASIYSVFAVDEYQEAVIEFNYKVLQGLNTYLRYTKEFYIFFDDANVIEVGLDKIRTDRVSGYLGVTLRRAKDGQDLDGIKGRVAYYWNEYFQTGIGAHLDVLERVINDDDDETTSSRIWFDINSNLSKTVSLQAKIERVGNDAWEEYYQGRVRLNARF